MTLPVIVKPPEPGSSKRAKCIRCDIAAQQEAAARLRELGLVPAEDGNKFVARGDEAIRFWTEGLAALPEQWDIFVPDDLVDVQVRDEALSANARVSSGVDWLSLRLNFESEGVAVTQEELARCLSEGRKYVRLSDGTFAKLDPLKVREVLQRQAEILATGGGNGGKLPLSQAGRIEELLAQAGRSAVTGDAKELFKKLRDIDEIKGTRKPRNLKAPASSLPGAGLSMALVLARNRVGRRPGRRHGSRQDRSGPRASACREERGREGRGQTKALQSAHRRADQRRHQLAPRDGHKFAPSLRHALWHGAERRERQDEFEDAEVVVTSYALLRRDEELLKEIDWRYVIVDEAQQIKNPLSATARAAKRLKADRRLALSGTPIENRLSEIWSIFDFVSPGLLGPLEKFEERYSPSDRQRRQGGRHAPRATIHPFILRRIEEGRGRARSPRGRSRPTSSAS